MEDSAGLADRHPAFLKDRGDELFRAGNCAGALNAYTRALELARSAAANPSSGISVEAGESLLLLRACRGRNRCMSWSARACGVA